LIRDRLTVSAPGPSLASATPISSSRANICYRIVNLWGVVPHLPPVLALYEQEGSSLPIDSGLTFDIVHNHLLITGCASGLASSNAHHPRPGGPLVGKTV
jgi:hypothetical protein